MFKIPFLKPNLIKKETYLSYLSKIDKSRIYTNYGYLNTLFENRVFNEYFKGIGAVTTVNNATIGLILAISQSKRRKGKYALMPSFTFAATPLAAMWCGLEPYFVDISQDEWCMNEEMLDKILKKLDDKVAVVVPYATFGNNLNLNYYQKLQDSEIPVVIDAASSFGSIYNNEQFGIGFSGFIVYSFHATKPFGVGEGGIVYSKNTDSILRIRQAGNFGFSINRESIMQGINAKMPEYTAAIALATLDVFPKKIKIRQIIYATYLEYFKKIKLLEKGWKFQEILSKPVPQFISLLCNPLQNNKLYIEHLAKHNIEARTYFSPACHQQKQFKAFKRTTLLITEEISKHILSLPLWEDMTKNDILRVVETINLL
ncbi:MAG: DegT/DnrJ/EryC1/StrS family aminotransferase [Armatimonadetes bacterium]|nr:DegT/DnrJ/EryC1/StrS family aminotransferase [Armatimonadota bacterium]